MNVESTRLPRSVNHFRHHRMFWTVVFALPISYVMVWYIMKMRRGRCTSNADLTGKTVIITGANQGKKIYVHFALDKVPPSICCAFATEQNITLPYIKTPASAIFILSHKRHRVALSKLDHIMIYDGLPGYHIW